MKLAFVVGTRPNFVKVAPLIVACRKYNVDYYLIHTGQHFDQNMSESLFADLDIPNPDVNLNINSEIPRDMKKETSEKIADNLVRIRPDFVVVMGDSDATAAGVMAAKKAGLKLAHVEAGLRSFCMAMPEEVNRIYMDSVADCLFVTETSGIKNLKDAKVSGNVFYVGNVMMDSLSSSFEKIKGRTLKFEGGGYAVTTRHRKKSMALLDYAANMYIKTILCLHPTIYDGD